MKNPRPISPSSRAISPSPCTSTAIFTVCGSTNCKSFREPRPPFGVAFSRIMERMTHYGSHTRRGTDSPCDLVVIGAGASGLACAISCAQELERAGVRDGVRIVGARNPLRNRGGRSSRAATGAATSPIPISMWIAIAAPRSFRRRRNRLGNARLEHAFLACRPGSSVARGPRGWRHAVPRDEPGIDRSSRRFSWRAIVLASMRPVNIAQNGFSLRVGGIASKAPAPSR